MRRDGAPGVGTRAPMVPLAYTVTARRPETADVATLDVAPIEEGIDDPAPGQFAMLYAFGVGEVPISVSGCRRDDGVLRHTIRTAGATSAALWGLSPGDPIGVRGPFGTSWPLDGVDGRDVVVIGGGIGLAPLRPVVRRVLARREAFGRVAVVAGARTPDDLLFREELAAWRGRFDLDVEVIVDAARAGWHGDVGLVTKVLPRLTFEASRTVAMVCGPEVMMRVVARTLADAGVAPEAINVSLERNMRCGVGHCGHCQIGPAIVCRDGPVVTWASAAPLLEVRRW